MKQINDPVFGDLEYDESKKAWTKKIALGIWGAADDELLDLVIKCDKEEEITENQREAYKSYLTNLSNIAKEVPEAIFSYYRDHFEDFSRRFTLPDELKLDVVDKLATICYFKPLELFIDRKGNYGWLSTFLSPQYFYTVVLSDGKPRIFKGWNVFKDFGIVDDDVFGEMFFDNGWRKWIKTDINGTDGEWLLLVADAMFPGNEIRSEHKENYQKYLQNEKTFLAEYPKVLLDYYQDNYEVISEIWDLADMYKAEEMDIETVKSLIQFNEFFLHMNGNRYGWVCECAWDKVYGLSIYYDNTKEGICIGSIDSLVI